MNTKLSSDHASPNPSSGTPSTLSRRSFLAQSLSATLAAGGAALGTGALEPTAALAEELGPRGRLSRANLAYRIRCKVARDQRRVRPPVHPTNGDEERYPTRIGNFSKGLPHNGIGEVDPAAYDALRRAIKSGRHAHFEAIPMGALPPNLQRKFVNPQSALAFDLEGPDSHALVIPPPPEFSSREIVSEIAENYWMALCRDIPFSDYGANATTLAAAQDLSGLLDFRGPKIGGQVTPQTLFRDPLPGTSVGPYLSQFFWLPAPFGAAYVEQRMRTVLPNVNYMTTFGEWLSIQRGEEPVQTLQFDPVRRYIRNGRDLGQWVHVDVLFQAYFHAMLILLTPPDASDANNGGIGAPFDDANPYRDSLTQEGFGTFGGPHVAGLMCEIASRAVKCVWYQKWSVHRRLRPEAFAGRVHNHLSGIASYPIATDELARTAAPGAVYSRYGSYLLPMAFPEGSPLHPSYGAGHATVAGACVTFLKAWFDESYVIPNPVIASPDGLSLLPYTGPALTVGGELNKLASNVATGRNMAGVHWRSDAAASLRLGEAIAIGVLKDHRATYNEDFAGFTLTTFDGETITV